TTALTARTLLPVLFPERGEIEREMLSDVAHVINDDVPLREAPTSVGAREPIAVTAGDDRLQWPRGGLLGHHECGAGGRGAGLLLDIDDHVRRQVTGAQ